MNVSDIMILPNIYTCHDDSTTKGLSKIKV